MAGYNGDSTIQFVEILVESEEIKNWGANNVNPGKYMLTAYQKNGEKSARFVFTNNAPNGSLTVLFATEAFSQLPEITAPDVIMPNIIPANSGKLCIENNPDNIDVREFQYCISYGDYSIDETNTVHLNDQLTIMNSVSLSRKGNFGFDLFDDSKTDFHLTRPTPANTGEDNFIDAGINKATIGTHDFQNASLVEQGKILFEKETFSGNSRTCQTCHLPPFFDMKPIHVKEKPDSDPLFIAEAGKNINTLTLTSNSVSGFTQPSDFRGKITDASGNTAIVIAGTGNTYRIIGGHELTGEISDTYGNTGTFVNFLEGDLNGPNEINASLNGLEDASGDKLRRSNSEKFPNGRALVLENIDGFEALEMFRSSPALINLKHTAPFGWSGEFETLADFTIGAVKQHFPISLARNENADFRMPTQLELDALVAFQESITSKVLHFLGDPEEAPIHSNKSMPTINARTLKQRIGLNEFTAIGCSNCHFGHVLSSHRVSLDNFGLDVNSFDTGVADQSVNNLDQLPRESTLQENGDNNREFNVPQLMEIRHTAPYFHDNSANTLEEVLDFYESTEFQIATQEFVDPGIAQLLSIENFRIVDREPLIEFLLTLSAYPFEYTKLLQFDELAIGSKLSKPLTIKNQGKTNLILSDIKLKIGMSSVENIDRSLFPLVDEYQYDPFVFDQFVFLHDIKGTIIHPGETFTFDVTYTPSVSGPMRTAQLYLSLHDEVDSWETSATLSGIPIGDDTTPPLYKTNEFFTDLPDPEELKNEFWIDEVVAIATGEKTLIEIPQQFFLSGRAPFLDNGTEPLNIVVSSDKADDNLYPIGTTIITTTATDIAGNTSKVFQKINVLDPSDSHGPIFSELKTINIESESELTQITLDIPIVTDESGIKSITNDAPALFPKGTTTVTWTAIDNLDNESNAEQQVVIDLPPDTTPPVFEPLTDLLVEATATLTTISLPQPVVSDESNSVSLSNNAPIAFPLGKSVVIWTAIDGAGNKATTTQNIEVQDTTSPTVEELADLKIEATSEKTIVQLTIPIVNEIFPIISLSNDKPDFYPLGETLVTWTIIDKNKNQSTPVQKVLLVDTTSPTIDLEPIRIYEAAGLETEISIDIPVVTDIFPIRSITNDAPTTFPLGETIVSWTALDNNGNEKIKSQTIQIVDTTAPTFSKLAQKTFDATALHSEIILENPEVFDLLGISSISHNGPNKFPLGNTEIIWTATDIAGNIATAAQEISLVDNVIPIISNTNDIEIESLTELNTIDLSMVQANDNLQLDSLVNNAPETFPIGETIVSWTATDIAGNQSTVEQKVTIIKVMEEITEDVSNEKPTTSGEENNTFFGGLGYQILFLLLIMKCGFCIRKTRFPNTPI